LEIGRWELTSAPFSSGLRDLFSGIRPSCVARPSGTSAAGRTS
jgi:hypothetical protein